MGEPDFNRYFDVVDYVVFGTLLAFSGLIGIYFAFWPKPKQNATAEYLTGGKKMGVFPVSMSLVASAISGIALLGFPSEIYVYGTQVWVLLFAETLTVIVVAIFFIPVFYKLEITSVYEYLNMRFSPNVRTLGSLFFLLKMVLYIPIVIYVPALALSQVSGFSRETLIPIFCVVCIFYTTLGGIKAVVWTDTLQMMLMLGGVVAVAVLGTIDVGGVQNVYLKNDDSGRLEFLNTSWDPTVRHTLWNVLIGKFFGHMASCTIDQSMVQRFLAVPTLKHTRMTMAISLIGAQLLVGLSCYTGLVIYTAFAECDPVSSGTISKAAQLLPYFVMKITRHVPALPGIFVSGICSAALSTMSTGLNSSCCVILEDIIKPLQKKPMTEARASFYMRAMTVFLGCICFLLAFLVDKVGSIYQVFDSLGSITGGPLLGMFCLGMLFPWANTIGALVGGLTASLLVGWMTFGSQIAIHSQQIMYPKKNVSIEGCDNATLTTYWLLKSNTSEYTTLPREPPFPLYTISYVYFTAIGLLTVLVVGMIVSCFTGLNDPAQMDPRLFSPVIQRFLNTGQQKATLVKRRKTDNPVSRRQNTPLLVAT